jgi:hypothetical protein
MVTKRTGKPRGRPTWDLRKDRDRYLIAAFWATQVHESQFNSNQRATRRSVAMLFAAIERGELEASEGNRTTVLQGSGKLAFGASVTRAQNDAGSNPIQARADDIRRKAERALREDADWTERMATAFHAAFYYPSESSAKLAAFSVCAKITETEFFGKSLVPFIEGRFDPLKAVVFTLPDFMPNKSEPSWP